MKKTHLIILTAACLLAACQPKTPAEPVNLDAARAAVNETINKYIGALGAKDMATVSALLAEDGLFCGTDASELWDKDSIMIRYGKAFGGSSADYSFSIDEREIRIAPDGRSAIVLEQFIMAHISTRMPIRMVYYLVETGDSWVIVFTSGSLIPSNKDLPVLNKVLEQEAPMPQ